MRTIFAEYNPKRNSIDVYTSAGYMLRMRVRLFTDLTSGELAYGLVHKMPTRKKHFNSSDCLISKGDYGKRIC